MMEQSVKQRGGEDGVVVEDLGPLLEDTVGGDQRGTALVSVATF